VNQGRVGMERVGNDVLEVIGGDVGMWREGLVHPVRRALLRDKHEPVRWCR
jgi:hypothetical protein